MEDVVAEGQMDEVDDMEGQAEDPPEVNEGTCMCIELLIFTAPHL